MGAAGRTEMLSSNNNGTDGTGGKARDGCGDLEVVGVCGVCIDSGNSLTVPVVFVKINR
jgi:hypothetical protein